MRNEKRYHLLYTVQFYPTGCPQKVTNSVDEVQYRPQIWRFERPGFGQNWRLWIGVGDIIEKIMDSRYIGIFTTYR